MLAVDGGATSTRALVGTVEGEVLSIGRAGPSNHVFGEAGRLRLKRALEGSVQGAMAKVREAGRHIEAAWLGMTGFREGSEREALIKTYLAELVDCQRVTVSSDLYTAHAGASALGDGILVYAGTGSVALAIDSSSREARAGGWGYLIDDEGAGYQIGRAALKAVYRAADGRGSATSLRRRILARFHCADLGELSARVYQDDGLDRPTMASLARLVSEAADADGDVVAAGILAAAGNELVGLCTAVARKLPTLGEAPSVFTAGGAFNGGAPLTDAFRRGVREQISRAVFRDAMFPPAIGAFLLALKDLSVAIDAELLDRIRESWARTGDEAET